jgi:hypothetical protein
MDNLANDIYEDGVSYLTGEESGQRALSKEVLVKYNVGLGTEKFINDKGVYQGFDTVFFPIYFPKQTNKKGSDQQ